MKRLAILSVVAAFLAVWVAVVYPVGYSGRGSKGEIDGATNAIRMLSYPHHEIHASCSFSVDYSEITASSDLDHTAIGLTTPATTTWGHMIATVTATSAAQFSIIEAPTIGTPGSGTDGVAVFNRNRNSVAPSVMLDQANPTPAANKVTTFDETEYAAATVSGGTVIYNALMSVGAGPKPAGGTSRDTQEWVLKQDTEYIFVIENVGASVNTHVINLSWYEHANL